MYAFYQIKAPFLQVIQWKYSTYRGNCNAYIANLKEIDVWRQTGTIRSFTLVVRIFTQTAQAGMKSCPRFY